jgi:hypothetical protein
MASPTPASLVDQILAVTGDYKAQQTPNGQLFPNVQNHGLPTGRCAVRHKKGSYHQFALRAECDIPPLLTHLRVAEACRMLEKNDLQAAATCLTVENEFARQGPGVVYAALCLWLDQNGIQVPESLRQSSTAIAPELEARLLLKRTDPIPFPISIAAIGCSDDSGTSVVPEEWLGRGFESGQQLCSQLDTLPHRQGLPESRYCSHYGLKLVPEPRWLTASEISEGLIPSHGISVTVENGHLSTSLEHFAPGTLKNWVTRMHENTRFLVHETSSAGAEDESPSAGILIACDKEAICEPIPTYQKTLSVGLLSSRLQKAIRRGRGASQTLVAAIEKLRLAPAYNLPDDHFKRSSGSRQLAWRLFISIFEDAEPYAPSPDGQYLSLPDLIALSLLAHYEPDLQFNSFILGKLIRTALLVQRNDAPGKNWDWRKGGKRTPITGGSPLEKSCAVALDLMPMMKRDAEMLRQGCDHLRKSSLRPCPLQVQLTNEELLEASHPAVEKATQLASHDFHCSPAILLHLQGSLPSIPELHAQPQPPTTQNLRQFLWENISRLNTRNPHHKPSTDPASQSITREIHAIQNSLLQGENLPLPKRTAYPYQPAQPPAQAPADPLVARIAFLSLFGQSTDFPAAGSQSSRRLKHAFTALVAGTPHEPCKIKKKSAKQSVYLRGEDRKRGEVDFVEYRPPNDELELPPPPAGYRWIFDQERIRLGISMAEDSTDPENGIEPAECPLVFHVQEQQVPAFDARCLLQPRLEPELANPSVEDAALIKQALYLDSPEPETHWETNQRLRILAAHRLDVAEPDLEWCELAEQSPLPPVVWQRVYTKLLGTFRGKVCIGPVDRHGDQLYYAVDYLYEGTLWRILNLLAFVAPQSVQPCGELDFKIHNESGSYLRLMRDIKKLASPRALSPAGSSVPTIRTPLWQHQASSVARITTELLENKRKGFGDASDVGSGKTLSSLAILANLARHNLQTQDDSAEAFLVLVYNSALVQTWIDEITKHTSGFNVVTQDASGKLSGTIGRHTILVTTLGRMRDTPVTRRWHLVVIDECLSVQNATALWTQEAWKQVACSQRGVLLLSATLFRSRFNELFYLLRMLRTGLPESKAYLDAILSESITCHLPENTPWKWTEETRLLSLDPETRQRYDHLQKAAGLQAKVLYGKLDALLVERFDFVQHLQDLLATLTPSDRALIFARSKEEAAQLAKRLENVSLFPEISGRHIVTTTAVGARGVNTLTEYNLIVTRPVEPDLVPQMKGRLARPGQNNAQLRWLWMVAENTIEEAKLERNQMAERFHDEHIVPLASFYQRAVTFGKTATLRNR